MKPVIKVQGYTIPEAWEKAIVTLYNQGELYPGRYWTNNDPMGRHAHMTIVIEDITEEPRIHRGFTCTPEDLWDYAKEMTQGSTRNWEYTYYGRMRGWGPNGLDQYAYALDCLARKGETHKAVMALADPDTDSVEGGKDTHIPCLRHISFELEKQNGDLYLNTYTHWRARNALHASFNNIFGMSFLIEKFITDLSERLNREVLVGGYVDVSDDFHFNGKDANDADRLISLLERPFSDRVYTLQDFLSILEE